MTYAVVQIGAKQYKVFEKDVVDIEKIAGKEKDKIYFDKVLLLVKDKKVFIGQPVLAKIKVKAEIVSQFKDKKIRVARFKAKSRYRKVKGHRQQKTKTKILKISSI